MEAKSQDQKAGIGETVEAFRDQTLGLVRHNPGVADGTQARVPLAVGKATSRPLLSR